MEETRIEPNREGRLPSHREEEKEPPFSLADALEIVEGDVLLLEEMTRAFLRYAPSLLAEILKEEGKTAPRAQGLLKDLEERAESVGALEFLGKSRRLREELASGGLSRETLAELETALDRFGRALAGLDWEDLDDHFPLDSEGA